MKKILILAVLAALGTQTFATHYEQKGNIDNSKSQFLIYEGKLHKMPTVESKFFHDFYSDCSGLKQQESGLIKSGKAEYIGASGTTHNIADLFSTYERRALSMGEKSMSFVSSHDADVIVTFDKEGKEYTVHIYTGSDATDYKNSLKK